MELTKLSTKGQIVIPDSIRSGLEEGTAFSVVKQGDLIVLKKVEGLNNQEIKEMQELDKIWEDIDSGKCETYEAKEFFKKMKEW